MDLTWSSDYKIPVDPSNKLAVSINYYIPSTFTRELYLDSFTWTDGNEIIYYYESTLIWGIQDDYFKIITDFELMKNTFISKGIPIIISEVGVLTEENIWFFLFLQILMELCVVYDTSNKVFRDMNFYDRGNNSWYDGK